MRYGAKCGTRFDSRQTLGHTFSKASRPAMRPNRTIQLVRVVLNPVQSGGDVKLTTQSSDEIRNTRSYTSTLSYVYIVWYISKHEEEFTYTSKDKVVNNNTICFGI
jgi:hypothetical protein